MRPELEHGHVKSRRAVRVVAVVGVLAAIQVIAIVVYRHVQSDRDERTPRGSNTFAVERVAMSNVSLALERQDKRPWTLDSVRGRPVVLHFWATWCGPCRAELPTLIAQHRRLDSQGIEVLLVSVDDDWAEVRDFFGAAGIPRSVSRATDDSYKRLTTGTLPETLFVDVRGTVHARARGARDWSSSGARQFLETLSR